MFKISSWHSCGPKFNEPPEGYGGLRQYLQAMYPNQGLRHEFYVWVASEIGVDPTVLYAGKFRDIPTAKPKEEDNVTPVCVPLQLFSFSDDAGLTGAPELEKSRLLLHLLCAYGCETVDESIKVRFPAPGLKC